MKICLRVLLAVLLLASLVQSSPVLKKLLFGRGGHEGYGGSSSFAASGAASHGGSAQSQAASFSVGDFSASISSSSAFGGRGGGYFDDY